MHHVVLLVLQDMAVPHVLSSSYAVTGQQPWAGWSTGRHVELHDDRDHLTWIHPDCLLPALLVRVSWTSGAGYGLERQDRGTIRVELPGFALEDIDVDQVEVHGMCVTREVENLP